MFTLYWIAIPADAKSYTVIWLYFRDRSAAASLRYRNRAEIALLIWEQKPYLVYGSRAGSKAIWCSLNIYSLEITGDPCNLIDSQQCDLFPNRTIFCFKSHLFPNQWKRNTTTAQPTPARVQFWNHAYDFRPNRTLLSSVTIVNNITLE